MFMFDRSTSHLGYGPKRPRIVAFSALFLVCMLIGICVLVFLPLSFFDFQVIGIALIMVFGPVIWAILFAIGQG